MNRNRETRTFGQRLRSLVRGIIAYDRRAWKQLVRQMEAEDRWVCNKVRGLFTH